MTEHMAERREKVMSHGMSHVVVIYFGNHWADFEKFSVKKLSIAVINLKFRVKIFLAKE